MLKRYVGSQYTIGNPASRLQAAVCGNFLNFFNFRPDFPAAFRRLCVETILKNILFLNHYPAAFRRLCVETFFIFHSLMFKRAQPPSGGCVLKPICWIRQGLNIRPAAFRRLCVETLIQRSNIKQIRQPPSGGCVLKL